MAAAGLDRLRDLAADLGARWHAIHADDLVQAIISPRGGSNVARIIAAAGEIGNALAPVSDSIYPAT